MRLTSFTKAFLGHNYPVYHAVVLTVALLDLAGLVVIWRKLR